MHVYGLPIEEVGKLIRTPAECPTEYGWHSMLADTPDYHLEKAIIHPGQDCALRSGPGEEATVLVEEGSVRLGDLVLATHATARLGPASQRLAAALEASVLYIFRGPAGAEGPAAEVRAGVPFDYRDKYWGNIQTIVNSQYAGKRLFFREGRHSSLHFHCRKTETYFVHSGELWLRLRAGRGEDRIFALRRGETLLIPPGLMHQNGGRQDTVLIEVSSHDEDADSFIVEDGARRRLAQL